MSYDMVALDASHWQETEDPPNWQILVDNGVVGIFLKCSEGTSYLDPTFRPRYDSAIEAGLAVSSYHFMRPGDGADQIAFYLQALKPRQGERVVIDWEDGGVGLEDVHDAVEWLIGERPDLQITVYASASFVRERVPAGDMLGGLTSLWVASYTQNPAPSDFGPAWEVWSLWQYTDKAYVSGKGPVDGNRFNGSADACRRWIGPAAEIPEDIATITVTIDADRPVNLNVVTGERVVSMLV